MESSISSSCFIKFLFVYCPIYAYYITITCKISQELPYIRRKWSQIVLLQCQLCPGSHRNFTSLSRKAPFFHLIAICETKLGPIVDDSIIALERYKILRQDSNCTWDGVELIVHHFLSVTWLRSSTEEWTFGQGLPEYLFSEVFAGEGPPMFFGVVYRPLHVPFLRNTDFIPDPVDCMHNCSSKIIVGDIESDPSSNKADAKFFNSVIEKNPLYSISYGSTNHRANVNSILDLCLVDAEDTVINFWNSDVPFSNGHDIMTSTIKSSLKKPNPQDFSFRDFISADTVLRHCLSHGWVSRLPLQQSRSWHIILYPPRTCSEYRGSPLLVMHELDLLEEERDMGGAKKSRRIFLRREREIFGTNFRLSKCMQYLHLASS